MIRPLIWESEFFGIKAAEVISQSDQNLIDATEFDFLVVKSDDEIETEIVDFKETFAEVKVIFCKSLEADVETSHYHIYEFNPLIHDLSKIYTLAFESGKYSRFWSDCEITSAALMPKNSLSQINGLIIVLHQL